MSDTALQAAGHAARRSRPRLLVALAMASCAGIYAAGLATGRAASLMAICGGVVWFPVYLLLRRHVEEAADLPEERLDEREIALRNRSYVAAYRLLGGAIAASLLLAIVDDAIELRLVESWLNPLAGLLLLSAVLPSAVLAITQTRSDEG